MQLVNQTPVVAELLTSHLPHTPNRRGLLTAKATFRFDGQRVELDRDAPLHVLTAPEPYQGGFLPKDRTMREREPFEVMLLGAVCCPDGEPVSHRRVRMAVGNVVRELDVFGDRVWEGDAISEPVPFERMPMTWERAFGGAADVEVDAGATVRVFDSNNPLGRGFDVTLHAEGLATALRVPEGYPVVPQGPRPLPNLENPHARIKGPRDIAFPICWAPMPGECAMQLAHLYSVLDDPGRALTYDEEFELAIAALRDAHPSWWIPRPARGARLQLSGVLPGGDVDLELPAMRVFGDYIVGERRGSRELVPQALVVLSDERRFTITYRLGFLTRYAPGDERGFRLRIEDGWYGES